MSDGIIDLNMSNIKVLSKNDPDIAKISWEIPNFSSLTERVNTYFFLPSNYQTPFLQETEMSRQSSRHGDCLAQLDILLVVFTL